MSSPATASAHGTERTARMEMTIKRTEAEIAAVVMEWMTEQLWDCYPEAEVPGGRADIVGVRPFPYMNRSCVHIVETKTTWSLSLLEQAQNRQAFAHYVSIAAPTKPSRFYVYLAKQMGIGLITFYSQRGDLTINEYEIEEPRLCRHAKARRRSPFYGPKRVLESLHEDMKRYMPGGTAASGYSSPWRRTMDRCAKYVRANPGCSVLDLVQNVDYHYSSKSGAKQGFLLWLQQRSDVISIKERGAMRFYPKDCPNGEDEQ